MCAGVCTWWIHRRSQTEPELCSRLQVQCRSEKNKKKVFLPVCLGIVAQLAALGVLVWKHLRNTREQESLRWNRLLGFSFNTTTICVFNRQQKVVLCFGNRVSTDVKWLKHSRENNALIFVVFWFRWAHDLQMNSSSERWALCGDSVTSCWWLTSRQKLHAVFIAGWHEWIQIGKLYYKWKLC